ncbi:hypothetical protein [Planococcus lenghuensis]|nr:hypothetical protein [Planococcus lenghuensis]
MESGRKAYGVVPGFMEKVGDSSKQINEEETLKNRCVAVRQ